MKKVILISLLALFSNSWAENNLPPNGTFISYHDNGKIALTGEIKNNKKSGIWKYIYNNSQLQARELYGGGKPIGTWQYFDKEGHLLQEHTFRKNNIAVFSRQSRPIPNGVERMTPNLK